MNEIYQSRWLPVALLTCSNVFMTFAWYGHLKFKSTRLPLVIVVSWGIPRALKPMARCPHAEA